MMFRLTAQVLSTYILAVILMNGYVFAASHPLAIQTWDVAHNGTAVAGSVTLLNQGKQEIGVGAMRLRVTDFAKTSLGKTEWVPFDGTAPGKTVTQVFKEGVKTDDADLVWLDLVYIPYPEAKEEESHDEKSARIYIKRVLNREIELKKVPSRIIKKTKFFALGGQPPIPYSKKRLKKALAKFSNSDSPENGIAFKEEPMPEEEERPMTAGVISFLKLKRFTDEQGNVMVELKLHNDIAPLPANRLTLGVKFYDGSDTLLKEVSFTVPAAVNKGPMILRFPTPDLPRYNRWQASYQY